jgi:16S rRNA (cytosine967-C5)-methyltransferase
MNPRAIAAKIIAQVLQGNSLTIALTEKLKSENQDNALIQEICYGVFRWYSRLEKLAQHFLEKPLKTKDNDIFALLLIGFYQLLFLRVPDHAAVFETVHAAKELKKTWAEKLINGILRRFLREKNSILVSLEHDVVSLYAHPLWLLNQIKSFWPDHWEMILKANNDYPPMTLRCNQNKIVCNDYLKKLQEKNIALSSSNLIQEHYFNAAITLTKPIPIVELPGFKEGLVSVQDEAAQIAAHLLQLQPGLQVLDACAAPGGKTSHILEMETKLAELIALDIDADRCKKITENLTRLQLAATVVHGDALKPETWWQGKLFDRILLDVPCSATGVIRRHPDIKFLRRESDLGTLADTQLKLLLAMWPLLQKNGILVYSTCSILPHENNDVVRKFLQQQHDALEIPINAPWGHPQPVGRQILPGENNRDGFYYAVLQKSL